MSHQDGVSHQETEVEPAHAEPELAQGEPELAQAEPAEQRQSIQAGLLTETGHPAVDSMLAGLGGIADLPAREQVTAYGEVHRALQETLATVDER